MGRSTLDMVIGIGLIVIGALLCLGKLGVGGLLPFAGIVLLVLGIVMLLGVVAGSTLLAIVCIVVGVLLMAGFLSLPKAIGDIMWIVNIVLGIILIILGVQRLRS